MLILMVCFHMAMLWVSINNPPLPEFWAGEIPLDFVITEDWETPTAFNTTPLHSIRSGRGSLVLYNQASAFHYMLTGEKKVDGAIDRYGSIDKLANAMAKVAVKVLAPEQA